MRMQTVSSPPLSSKPQYLPWTTIYGTFCGYFAVVSTSESDTGNHCSGEFTMALEQTDVQRAAHLARLALDDADAARYVDDLGRILEMVDQLQAVDTQGVAPLAHPLDATQRLRADEVTESDQRDHFQQGAPAVENGLYLVPRVVE